MRILIYSQDGFGLGHLRRNLNISLQVKKLCPSASILIIADSPVAPFFDLPPRVDFIKIPTIIKVDMGIWRPNGLPVNYKELMRIRSDIIQNTALSFRPHVFLVDHMPNGALGELSGPLKMLKRYCPDTRIVLGLRDILGAPDAIRNQWSEEGAYDAAEAFYDSVCIYGCSDLFDLPTEYKFTAPLLSKTCDYGYVCRQEEDGEEFEEEVLLRLFPKFKGKFVLVTGGGGHDASQLMDTFVDAVAALSPEVPFDSIIATGPFMHPTQFQKLTAKVVGLPIVVTPSGPDAIRLMRRADLVISMAGYNTISEILQLRKKAIVVPRPGPSAEQTIRGKIMSDRGLFNMIHPNDLTAETLAAVVSQKIQNGKPMQPQQIPELQGASKMASLMLS